MIKSVDLKYYQELPKCSKCKKPIIEDDERFDFLESYSMQLLYEISCKCCTSHTFCNGLAYKTVTTEEFYLEEGNYVQRKLDK